jgi:hypothetical protein
MDEKLETAIKKVIIENIGHMSDLNFVKNTVPYIDITIAMYKNNINLMKTIVFSPDHVNGSVGDFDEDYNIKNVHYQTWDANNSINNNNSNNYFRTPYPASCIKLLFAVGIIMGIEEKKLILLN